VSYCPGTVTRTASGSSRRLLPRLYRLVCSGDRPKPVVVPSIGIVSEYPANRNILVARRASWPHPARAARMAPEGTQEPPRYLATGQKRPTYCSGLLNLGDPARITGRGRYGAPALGAPQRSGAARLGGPRGPPRGACTGRPGVAGNLDFHLSLIL